MQLRGTANPVFGRYRGRCDRGRAPDIRAMWIRAASAIALTLLASTSSRPTLRKRTSVQSSRSMLGQACLFTIRAQVDPATLVAPSSKCCIQPPRARAYADCGYRHQRQDRTVTRMVSHFRAREARTSAWRCTDGVWIGGRQIVHGDSAGRIQRGRACRPRVEAAVVEADARNRAPVSVTMARCRSCHQCARRSHRPDGIKSIDDLVAVKGL